LLLAGGTLLHGWSLTVQGQSDEGLRQLRQGLADWQATGALSHRPFQLALLAESLGRVGRFEEALGAVAEALNLAATIRECFWEAELHRLQGELQLACAPADHDAAAACLQRALTVAGRQGSRSLELRATLSLGHLYPEQGRPTEARQLLAGTVSKFT